MSLVPMAVALPAGVAPRPRPGRTVARVAAILALGAAGLVLGAVAGAAVLLASGLVALC